MTIQPFHWKELKWFTKHHLFKKALLFWNQWGLQCSSVAFQAQVIADLSPYMDVLAVEADVNPRFLFSSLHFHLIWFGVLHWKDRVTSLLQCPGLTPEPFCIIWNHITCHRWNIPSGKGFKYLWLCTCKFHFCYRNLQAGQKVNLIFTGRQRRKLFGVFLHCTMLSIYITYT